MDFVSAHKQINKINIPKWNAPDHGESWTEKHLHSGRKRTCRTTLMVPFKCQGKLSILFEPCYHLRTYCSLLFCYKLATNMLICCPISDKMVFSVVSACLIADYLYPNFLWKPFAYYLSLSVSFISTSLAQPYCMVHTALSFACPINGNNQRRTCNMYLHMYLDLNLAAF